MRFAQTHIQPAIWPGFPGNESKIGHVLGHHRAGADKGVLSNGDTANDCTVGAESRAPANQGRTQFIHAPNLAARVKHVGKNHRRTAKYIVLESHAFINGDVILDFDPVANVYIGSDDYILPNPTVLANLRVLQDMRNMPDGCSFADLHVIINES